MIRKLVVALLTASFSSVVAAWPCNVGDGGRLYIIDIVDGCGNSNIYGITCGGELGDQITNITRLNPYAYDCVYA